MQLLLQKMTERTAFITDTKPETSNVESKMLPDKMELRKLPEPETCKKTEQTDKTVHWQDNESAEKLKRKQTIVNRSRKFK